MKTTLTIDDTVMERLKSEAARRGTTMSQLVEAALRAFFRKRSDRKDVPELPSFCSEGALVDVANRSALHDLMDER